MRQILTHDDALPAIIVRDSALLSARSGRQNSISFSNGNGTIKLASGEEFTFALETDERETQVLEERGSDLVLMGVAKSSVSSLQNNPRPAKRSKNAPLFVPPPQYEEEAATAVVANGKKSLSFASDAAKMSACKEVVKLLAVSKLSEGEVIARVQWRQDVLEPVLQEVTQKDRDGKLLLKDDAAVWDLLDPKELPTEHRASALRTLSRLGLRSEKMEAALVRYAEMRKELQEARAAVAKVYAALKKSPTESPEKALQVVARLQHRVKAVARDGQKLMEEIDALGGQTRKSNKK